MVQQIVIYFKAVLEILKYKKKIFISVSRYTESYEFSGSQ